MNENIEVISEMLSSARDSMKHYTKLVLELERQLMEELEK